MRDLDGSTEVIRNYVGGRWVRPASAEVRDIHNPATALLLGQVPMSDADDVDAAVRAAQKAYREWRATPPQERARYLMRFRDLIATHADELARLIVTDMGKTLEDARGEVQRGIESLEAAS